MGLKTQLQSPERRRHPEKMKMAGCIPGGGGDGGDCVFTGRRGADQL